MKLFVVLAVCLAVAAAATTSEVTLVKETVSDNDGLGKYNFAYELSDGQARQETAELKNAGSKDAFVVMRGSYTYVDPATGVKYTVTYVADENGFQAEGDHLPKVE